MTQGGGLQLLCSGQCDIGRVGSIFYAQVSGAPTSMLRSLGLQLLCSGQCGIGRGAPISLALDQCGGGPISWDLEEEEEEEEEEEVGH